MAVTETKPATRPRWTCARKAADYLVRRHHFRWPEALPWLIAIACYFAFPDRMTFGNQVLVMVIFALSLDLILGYAGIVTLGHAAFFGIGAYVVALAALRLGWSEPISGIIAGGLVAGLVGVAVGWFMLRYRGLTLLMLTIAFAAMLQESGNLRSDFTGGYDGLPGLMFSPLFGTLRLRPLRPRELSLRARRAGGGLLFRAPHRLFAVRAGAHRHPRERRGACTPSARRCTGGW